MDQTTEEKKPTDKWEVPCNGDGEPCPVATKQPLPQTPQEFLAAYDTIKADLKNCTERLEQIQDDFVSRFGTEYEFPVLVEGKKKFMRVFTPDGFYVFNRKWEVGIRVKPENPAPENRVSTTPITEKTLEGPK